MDNEKSKEIKRIKPLRVGFIASIILVFLSVYQIIFESADNFHMILNWMQLLVWITSSIFSWFQLKEAKEKLQEIHSSGEI